jgi:hypothetical protein
MSGSMQANGRLIPLSGWKAGLAFLLVVTLGVVAALAGVFLLVGGAVLGLLAAGWLRLRFWLAGRAIRAHAESLRVETGRPETGLEQSTEVREIQVDEVMVRDMEPSPTARPRGPRSM